MREAVKPLTSVSAHASSNSFVHPSWPGELPFGILRRAFMVDFSSYGSTEHRGKGGIVSLMGGNFAVTDTRASSLSRSAIELGRKALIARAMNPCAANALQLATALSMSSLCLRGRAISVSMFLN